MKADADCPSAVSHQSYLPGVATETGNDLPHKFQCADLIPHPVVARRVSVPCAEES